MSTVTVSIPDELAARIKGHEQQIPEILALGLRELHSDVRRGFEGAAEVMEFFAGLPSPEATLNLRASEDYTRRVEALIARSKQGGLTVAEEEEWARYEFLEHLVRIAKTNAAMKLGISPATNG